MLNECSSFSILSFSSLLLPLPKYPFFEHSAGHFSNFLMTVTIIAKIRAHNPIMQILLFPPFYKEEN